MSLRVSALSTRLKTSARALRQKQTDTERLIWGQLRSRRFLKVKFRRQFPIGPYIVDFCSLTSKLIVELDGGQHGLNRLKDGKRTKYLEAEGFHVIRFWNHDVFKNLDVVLEQIQQKVQDNPLTLPSPASGRGKPKSPPRLNE